MKGLKPSFPASTTALHTGRGIAVVLRITRVPLCLAGLMPAMAGPAWSQAVDVTGVLSVASDYTDRGLLSGERKPALQGEVSALFDSHWSASLALGLQQDARHNHRFAARLAHYWALSNDWQADVELRWTDYRNEWTSWEFRYAELGGSATFRDLLSVGIATRRYAGHDDLRWALDTGLRWPIAGDWSANGSLGWAQLPSGYARWYRYGSAGLGWQHGSWSAGVSRIWADKTARAALDDSAQPHWSAFVSKDF